MIDAPATACVCGDGQYTMPWKLGPGHTVMVCRAAYRQHPKWSCLAKTLLQRWACPGCGSQQCGPGQLCAACTARLAGVIAKEKMTVGDTDVRPRAVKVGTFLRGDHAWFHRASEANSWLIRLLGGVPYHVPDRNPTHRAIPAVDHVVRAGLSLDVLQSSGWHTAFVADLSDGQTEALRELLTVVGDAVTEAASAGFREGSSVLRRLATGDMSVLSFEKETERR